MAEKKTSEAKLLDIIKRKSKKGFWQKMRLDVLFQSATALFQNKIFPYLQRTLRKPNLSPIQMVNRVLGGLTGLALVTLIIGFFLPNEQNSQIDHINIVTEKKISNDSENKVSTLLEPEAINLKTLSRRNLFQSMMAPARPKPKRRAAPPPPPKIPLQRRAAHLKLVGIISETPPQAVIEDSKKRTTLYVKSGELIGEIRVQSVTQNGVTLAFEEETYELRL